MRQNANSLASTKPCNRFNMRAGIITFRAIALLGFFIEPLASPLESVNVCPLQIPLPQSLPLLPSRDRYKTLLVPLRVRRQTPKCLRPRGDCLSEPRAEYETDRDSGSREINERDVIALNGSVDAPPFLRCSGTQAGNQLRLNNGILEM